MKTAFLGVVAKGVAKGAKKILPKTWVGKGTLGADLLQPGAALSRRLGVKKKPNLLDEIVFFGAPVTAGTIFSGKGTFGPNLSAGHMKPPKSDRRKAQEIKRYGHSTPEYDRGSQGQKLMH